MRNRLTMFLCLLILSCNLFAQQLIAFNSYMQPGGKSYVSITNKKVYTVDEAADVKSTIDLALILTNDATSPKLEWYNLSGKDGKVPEKLVGTSAKIIGLSFDREQFDKCKTAEDLKRMTGHLTPNSFSHFAVVSHTKNEINYHCFIAETINGKRALIWISKDANDGYKVEIKQQP
jgi:hypothetical protein